jgi:apolipoprotein N-acyltransferase
MSQFVSLARRFRIFGAEAIRWRVFAVLFCLGLLTVLSLPPVYGLPVLLLVFPIVIWMLESASTARALWIGWSFGFGFFAAGTYWMGEAFLVDAARTGWLAPFAVGGLAAGLAFFPGLGFAAIVWIWRKLHLSASGRVLTFAASWTIMEWLRGHILTGFPWNLLGTVWAGDIWMTAVPVAQTASLIGVYGLSLVTIAAAAMPAILDGRRRSFFICAVVTLIFPALLAAGGAVRRSQAPDPALNLVPDIHLRIVQANIDQSLKWVGPLRAQHLRDHLEMSAAPTTGPTPTHIVWPEAAVPFAFSNDAEAAAAAASIVPAGGALLTGALRFGTDSSDPYNSLHAIGPNAQIIATYDKVHLVPFGEYIPARGILPFDRLVPNQGDVRAGDSRRPLVVDGLPPFAPLICYEAAFPSEVTAHGLDRPEWMLNVTNDAWFGKSAGPYQHFATARLRTVEEGLPLVRAANTGISAVIDPWGRITGRLGLGTKGILDIGLPRPARVTLYARFGDLGLVVMLFAVALLSTVGRTRAS